MDETKHLRLSLLLLRISVFVVMLMWTVDKFINPEHAAQVYAHFYFLPGLGSTVFIVIGIVELVILLMFLAGYLKTYTYGAVLAFHTVSTFTPYKQYLAPFDGPNLLFFAAWPMLAACFALFLLREADQLYTVSS